MKQITVDILGWVFASAWALFILDCFRRLALALWPRKTETFSGPNPSPQQLREASAWATDYLKRNPGASDIAKFFPDEAKMADLLRQYENAEFLYNTGHISETVYQAIVDNISDQIDVSEITQKP